MTTILSQNKASDTVNIPMDSYSCISFTEIHSILKADNVPTSVWPVYLVMVSYDYGFSKCAVFPKIDTIVKALGGKVSKRSVYRAIAWMVDHKVIKRNRARIKDGSGGSKTNQNRFVLIKRKLHKFAAKVSEVSSSIMGEILPNNAKNTSSKIGKGSKGGVSTGTRRRRGNRDTFKQQNKRKWSRSKPSQDELKRRAEQAERERARKQDYDASPKGLFERMVFDHHFGGTPVSEIERLRIYQYITENDNDWIRWAKESNGLIVSKLINEVEGGIPPENLSYPPSRPPNGAEI